jgi:hypothetical protein
MRRNIYNILGKVFYPVYSFLGVPTSARPTWSNVGVGRPGVRDLRLGKRWSWTAGLGNLYVVIGKNLWGSQDEMFDCTNNQGF